MKKRLLAVLLAGAMVLSITACGSSKDSSKSTTEAAKKEETTTITLAAAASLEKCYTEKLIPMFEKENKGIKVEGSYDSSGKLQRDVYKRQVNIRGNVDTRLRKMEEQELDGIILSAAGLKRLGMQDVITQYLEPEEMISAPAQGVLALEVREDQKELQQMLDVFSDEDVYKRQKLS